MRLCLLLFVFFRITNLLNAQNVGIGTPLPASSAILELRSFDKGILIPRLSNFNMEDIVSPRLGLLIYNIDQDAFMYYDFNNEWVKIIDLERALI